MPTTRVYSWMSIVNTFSGTGITVVAFASVGECIRIVLSQDPEMTESLSARYSRGYLSQWNTGRSVRRCHGFLEHRIGLFRGRSCVSSPEGDYQLTFPFTHAVTAFRPSCEKRQSRRGAGWLYWDISWAEDWVEMV